MNSCKFCKNNLKKSKPKILYEKYLLIFCYLVIYRKLFWHNIPVAETRGGQSMNMGHFYGKVVDANYRQTP